MRKVGILGGTFNPPHIGHLLIANEVKHMLSLDEVRLMPTAVPPHKAEPDDASALQRLQMVELAVAELDGLTVSSFEVERGGISRTYDTIEQLQELEPTSDFHFIIGGDMIDYLPKWHRIEELTSMVKFVGVGRPGTIGMTDYPITILDTPQIDLSSTLIRQRFATNRTVQLLVPPSVEAFIRKEGLYGCSTS